MENDSEKKQITIEVEPRKAVIIIGLVKVFLPTIIEYMKTKFEHILTLEDDDDYEQSMYDTINEIYEKCIKHTTIREDASKYAEIIKRTGKLPDGTVN